MTSPMRSNLHTLGNHRQMSVGKLQEGEHGQQSYPSMPQHYGGQDSRSKEYYN